MSMTAGDAAWLAGMIAAVATGMTGIALVGLFGLGALVGAGELPAAEWWLIAGGLAAFGAMLAAVAWSIRAEADGISIAIACGMPIGLVGAALAVGHVVGASAGA